MAIFCVLLLLGVLIIQRILGMTNICCKNNYVSHFICPLLNAGVISLEVQRTFKSYDIEEVKHISGRCSLSMTKSRRLDYWPRVEATTSYPSPLSCPPHNYIPGPALLHTTPLRVRFLLDGCQCCQTFSSHRHRGWEMDRIIFSRWKVAEVP